MTNAEKQTMEALTKELHATNSKMDRIIRMLSIQNVIHLTCNGANYNDFKDVVEDMLNCNDLFEDIVKNHAIQAAINKRKENSNNAEEV